MDFQYSTVRRLHEEHEATLDLLNRFEQRLTGRGGRYPPPDDDAAWHSLARAVATALRHEIDRHFAFEEEQLFPRLDAAGEGDIAAILLEEHRTIREVATPLAALLDQSVAQGGREADAQRLRTLGLELCERLVAHVQKEEMALLPALEYVLDAPSDQALSMEYGAA